MNHSEVVSSVQVITVANAYELVFRSVRPYAALSELARADELHFGQKSSLWATPFGWPDVVVCTQSQSEAVARGLWGRSSDARPTFVTPRRVSSSICLDFLQDAGAKEGLINALDRSRPVHIAPYLYTRHVSKLVEWLRVNGFDVRAFPEQASLVASLCDKTYTSEHVFSQSQALHRLRPTARVARTSEDLRSTIGEFSRRGISRVVVKSASAVGGAGVYFVEDTFSARRNSLDVLLAARGNNEADRSAPFLVEEWIPAIASPTVDVYIEKNGEVSTAGVAVQRLYDGRYYIGFHYDPEMRSHEWYRQVLDATHELARILSRLGYYGPANVDFIVVPDGGIRLIELNPRRSALLDGFGLATREYGAWDRVALSVADYVTCRSTKNALEIGLMLRSMSPRATVQASADGGLDSKFGWLSLWASRLNTEEALETAVGMLRGPFNGTEDEDVGRVFCRVLDIAA